MDVQRPTSHNKEQQKTQTIKYKKAIYSPSVSNLSYWLFSVSHICYPDVVVELKLLISIYMSQIPTVNILRLVLVDNALILLM